MNKILLFLSAMLFVGYGYAQPSSTDYSDVVVIVNTNDTMSMNIGNYFMQKRNIPARNMIRLNVPAKETISTSEWATLKKQMEDSLAWKPFIINYLVTTKGVPLRVNNSGSGSTSQKASVDSELMLVATGNSGFVGGQGPVQHTYYNKNAHFASTTYGMYLVTRLTGYTQQDVYDLIDNSGPNTYVDKSKVQFVLDKLFSGGYASSSQNTNLTAAHNYLVSQGWNDTLSTTTNYIKNQQNVLGYWSFGSNHPGVGGTSAIPGNTWSKASIAETAVSTSARSFKTGTTYGQSLVADWIAEGVTGMSGFVYEPFLTAVADPYLLFTRYVYPATTYNLAESFYMASPFTSWMQVVVGDPKTSIVTTTAPVEEYVQEFDKVNVYPNPNNGLFTVDYELFEAKEVSLSVVNVLGQEVYNDFIPETNVYREMIDISNFDKGVYYLVLTTGSGKLVTRSLVVD